tara:strand:+ start:639 stop:3107 length:2469 start_codon:yes stop_codon:yes gene_type:complete
MVAAAGGIGNFRDPGDPFDPRRRRGAMPVPRIVPGLPVEQNDDPRQYTSNLAKVISGELDEAVVRDPRIANKGAQKPVISAAELLGERTEYPSSPAIYGSFMGGLPRETDTRDLRAANSDPDPSFARKTDEFTDDLAIYGTMQVPERQISGQYTRRPSERRRGGEDQRRGLVLKTVDPQRPALTREGDLDSPYASSQTDELSLGRLAKELKSEAKTPVIGETALVNNRLSGTERRRFRSLEQMPIDVAESMVEAFGKESGPGNFVGIYEVSPSAGGRPQREKGVFSSTATKKMYVPVYRVIDRETGDPKVTMQDVPDGYYSSKQVAEPLYRLGNPFAFDSSAVMEELGTELGRQTIRKTPDGRGAVVRKETVAGSGIQLFADKVMDESGQTILASPVTPEQVDGSRPLYFQRESGKVDALIPRLDEQGVPTGSYISTGKYTERTDVGPGAASSSVGVAKGAGNPDTYIDNRNRYLGTLGDANATSTSQLISDLAAMASTTEPVTRNAYRDVIAPMILTGRLSQEQVDEIAPRESYARQLIDQAVQEVANQSAPREVIGGGSDYIGTGESYGVDVDDFSDADIRDEATFDEARRDRRETGYSYISNPELEGIADPDRYRRVTEMIRQRLQGGLDDSEVILGRGGTGPRREGSVAAGTNADQARYLADVVLRNVGDEPGSSARAQGRRLAMRKDLGGLLGGEVTGEMGGRIGNKVTGQQASFARALRDYYQRQAPGLPYDESLGSDQVTYSDVAANLGSADPAIQEQAMQDMQGVMRGRQVERKQQPPEMGEYLNAPQTQTTTQPPQMESVRQRAMRIARSLIQ